jgi:hypothetical protein
MESCKLLHLVSFPKEKKSYKFLVTSVTFFNSNVLFFVPLTISYFIYLFICLLFYLFIPPLAQCNLCYPLASCGALIVTGKPTIVYWHAVLIEM